MTTNRKQVEAIDARVGEKIREAREALGMPQAHVSTVMSMKFGLGWHQTTTTKVERAERPLRLSEAVALASILGLSVADLVGEATEAERVAVRELRSLKAHIDSRIKELS